MTAGVGEDGGLHAAPIVPEAAAEAPPTRPKRKPATRQLSTPKSTLSKPRRLWGLRTRRGVP